MDIKTLTDRIVAKADDKLKRRIVEAAAALDNICRDGTAWGVEVNGKDVAWYQLVEAIKNGAFIRRQQENRQKAIDEFEKEVDRLRSEIDELTAGGGE